MEKKTADRRAILTGSIDIWLKKPEGFLNKDWEICPVKHFTARQVAIIESDGRCYASLPSGDATLTGMLYETRDTFDELTARYPQKDK